MQRMNINFIEGHLRLKKELNLYRLQNLKKIVRPRVEFCPPTGPCPQTGTFPNWHFPQLALFWTFFCAIENDSLSTAGTPSKIH